MKKYLGDSLFILYDKDCKYYLKLCACYDGKTETNVLLFNERTFSQLVEFIGKIKDERNKEKGKMKDET